MGEFAHPKSLNAYGGAGTGWNRNVVHALEVVEMATTQLQTGDITWLMYVTAGAVVVDGFVKASDMDTGTSLAYNIGDATTTNLFFANTTTGQSAGSSSIVGTSRYTKFAAATRLKLTVATTAETAAAGRIHFGLSYFIDPEVNVTTGATPITVA